VLGRPRAARSHQAEAAWPRRRSEPEARRRQARRLPGQPPGRPRVDTRTKCPGGFGRQGIFFAGPLLSFRYRGD
jgi:hypothetical protein